MKKIALISAAAAATTLALAPAAFAAPTQSLTVSLTSKKAGTSSKPTAVGMTFDTGTTSTDPAGGKQTLQQAKITLPKGLKLNYKAFPSCSEPTTCADSAPKSQVGSGSAVASVLGIDTPANGTLTPFIGSNNQLIIRTEFSAPAIIDEPLLGAVSVVGGQYVFTFNVPEDLQVPIPNAPQQISSFKLNFKKLTVKKGKKTIPLIGLTSCPSGGYVFKGDFTYRPQTAGAVSETATASQTIKCTKAKKK
jgi:hypothetical protein